MTGILTAISAFVYIKAFIFMVMGVLFCCLMAFMLRGGWIMKTIGGGVLIGVCALALVADPGLILVVLGILIGTWIFYRAIDIHLN